MKEEIEVRFAVDTHDGVRSQLQALGAALVHPMRAMRRVIIDYPDQRLQHGTVGYWSFIRLRDEGERVQLTYKQIAKTDQYETQEIELAVSSYDTMLELFEKIGLKAISEQHTRREVWHLGGCEVSLDQWPWVPPVVEIEGPDAERVRTVTNQLGFSWQESIPGNIVTLYRRTFPGMTEEDSVRDIVKLSFDEMPQWLKDRR